jgi:hypothetical protein
MTGCICADEPQELLLLQVLVIVLSIKLNSVTHVYEPLSSAKPEIPLLQRPEVEEDVIDLPSNHAHEEPCHSIEDVVVGCAYDCKENQGRVQRIDTSQPLVWAKEEQRHPDHE